MLLIDRSGRGEARPALPILIDRRTAIAYSTSNAHATPSKLRLFRQPVAETMCRCALAIYETVKALFLPSTRDEAKTKRRKYEHGRAWYGDG